MFKVTITILLSLIYTTAISANQNSPFLGAMKGFIDTLSSNNSNQWQQLSPQMSPMGMGPMNPMSMGTMGMNPMTPPYLPSMPATGMPWQQGQTTTNPYQQIPSPNIQGIWESNKGSLLIIGQGLARLHQSKERYQDYYLKHDQQHIWMAPKEGGAMQSYQFQLKENHLALRDSQNRTLLFRKIQTNDGILRNRENTFR